MNLLSVFLIAVGLAMDAFAVSVSTGMTVTDYRWTHCMRMSSLFGIFQCFMPIIGFFAASRFSSYIENFDHWIAFVLLSFIGGKMLWEAFAEKEEKPLMQSTAEPCDEESVACTPEPAFTASEILTARRLIVLAVATSIDALAVGVSFAFLGTDIWWPSVLIGIVAFVFSFMGGMLGKKIGPVLGKTAEIAGGIILIGIGVKIILDHMVFAG